MVIVNFESPGHSEMQVVFRNEELYNSCFRSLNDVAKKHRMIVTESIVEDCYITQDIRGKLSVIDNPQISFDSEFLEWVMDDNVVKQGHDDYKTQCTQWHRKFTLAELKKYFIQEYTES